MCVALHTTLDLVWAILNDLAIIWLAIRKGGMGHFIVHEESRRSKTCTSMSREILDNFSLNLNVSKSNQIHVLICWVFTNIVYIVYIPLNLLVNFLKTRTSTNFI